MFILRMYKLYILYICIYIHICVYNIYIYVHNYIICKLCNVRNYVFITINMYIQCGSAESKEDFLREIAVMAKFMHPNIIKVYGSVDKGVAVAYAQLVK